MIETVPAEFARNLERGLTTARAALAQCETTVEMLNGVCKRNNEAMPGLHAQISSLTAKLAQCEEKHGVLLRLYAEDQMQLGALTAAHAKAVEDGKRLKEIDRSGLEAFWREQSEWSQATFGTDAERGPIGALKHLAKEAVEAQACPQDLMEFVDCLFLTFDATRRAGFTFDELRFAAWRKLAINKVRKWGKPTNGDEPVEHDRTGEASAPATTGKGGAL